MNIPCARGKWLILHILTTGKEYSDIRPLKKCANVGKKVLTGDDCLIYYYITRCNHAALTGDGKMIKVEKYNVRIVNTGDKYGRFDCLTNDKEQMVEFYDSRYDHESDMGRGQFVSRYYTSTILNGQYPNGLCLDGGIPEWSVSKEGMDKVVEFLKSI